MSKFQTLLTSRRFLILVGGMVSVFSEELFGFKITEDQLNSILALAATWMACDTIRKTE